MKSSQIAYNIELNLEKNEKILIKLITHISEPKALIKLNALLNDILTIKNKLYKYIYKDLTNEKVTHYLIKDKYEEYKNIVSFL